jgi:anti-sigma regulatory factor (Ser/Thr protein kinase)
MCPDTREQVFSAKPENVASVTEFVSAIAEEAGIHAKRLLHLQLALEEAVMNIGSYAYETPPGELLVRVTTSDDRFVTELIDEGVPFDPMAMDTPNLKAELDERRIGGLGIFLLRKVMDEVHYRREDGRNILTLVVCI